MEVRRCVTLLRPVKLHVTVLAQMMGFVQPEDFKVLVMHRLALDKACTCSTCGTEISILRIEHCKVMGGHGDLLVIHYWSRSCPEHLLGLASAIEELSLLDLVSSVTRCDGLLAVWIHYQFNSRLLLVP